MRASSWRGVADTTWVGEEGGGGGGATGQDGCQGEARCIYGRIGEEDRGEGGGRGETAKGPSVVQDKKGGVRGWEGSPHPGADATLASLLPYVNPAP
jgi:hypothetical protein